MIDLYNFLGDLVNSCPKAQQQFKDRVAKFHKIKTMLPSLNLNKTDEAKFLRYIQTHLNDFSLPQINTQAIQTLYNTFKRS